MLNPDHTNFIMRNSFLTFKRQMAEVEMRAINRPGLAYTFSQGKLFFILCICFLFDIFHYMRKNYGPYMSELKYKFYYGLEVLA